MNHELVDLITKWGFVHGETIGLLRFLTDGQLLFTPGGESP